jgi:hypothetical protein
MFTYSFWLSTLERSVKTFAQAALAVLGAGGAGLFDAPWTTALSTAVMAAILSVLTSMTSAPVGLPHDPSVLGASRPQSESVHPPPASVAA